MWLSLQFNITAHPKNCGDFVLCTKAAVRGCRNLGRSQRLPRNYGKYVDGSAERYDLIVGRRALVIYHDTTDNAGIRQYLNDEYVLSLASDFADDVAHSYNDTCIRGYAYYLDNYRYESIYDSLRADVNVYSIQRAFKSSRNGIPPVASTFRTAARCLRYGSKLSEQSPEAVSGCGLIATPSGCGH